MRTHSRGCRRVRPLLALVWGAEWIDPYDAPPYLLIPPFGALL